MNLEPSLAAPYLQSAGPAAPNQIVSWLANTKNIDVLRTVRKAILPTLKGSESEEVIAAIVNDISGSALLPQSLAKLRVIDLTTLPVVDPATRIGACVVSVGKFICIGLNYSDHAAESGMAVPTEQGGLHEGDVCHRWPIR